MGGALSMLINVLNNMAPAVADIMLKAQGSSLDEYAEKMAEQDSALSQQEDAPDDKTGKEPATGNEA